MGLFIAQILTGLANARALFMVASGLSLNFGVTRIVNFAHGSFYMLGAYIGYSLMQVLPGAFGFWISILLAGVLVGLLGVIVEICVLRPVYRAPELFQLVATFGVILVLQELTLMVWGPVDLLGPRAPGLKGIIRILDEPVPKYDLALIAITPFVALALWYFITKTRVGILIRAATQDREMVGALGVNQAWLFTGVFFSGCGTGRFGGCVAAAQRRCRSFDGFQYTCGDLCCGCYWWNGVIARGVFGCRAYFSFERFWSVLSASKHVGVDVCCDDCGADDPALWHLWPG